MNRIYPIQRSSRWPAASADLDPTRVAISTACGVESDVIIDVDISMDRDLIYKRLHPSEAGGDDP